MPVVCGKTSEVITQYHSLIFHRVGCLWLTGYSEVSLCGRITSELATARKMSRAPFDPRTGRARVRRRFS
jgi:hypothetical protein